MADAGFFGTSWEDPRTQATLAAAAGLLGGGTFTESLTRGLLGYQGGINKARDEEIKRRLAEAQMQSLLAEAEQRRAEAAKYQASMAERARIQQVIAANMGGPITGGQAASAGGGPTPAAAGAVGKALPPNFTQMILDGVPPEIVKAIAESPNLGLPEVGGQIETVRNGAPVTVMRDKYGNPIGDALPKWVEPKLQNLGGMVASIDPVTGKVVPVARTSASPDAIMADRRGWAQIANDALKTQWETGQGVGVPSGMGFGASQPGTAPAQTQPVPNGKVPAIANPAIPPKQRAELIISQPEAAQKVSTSMISNQQLINIAKNLRDHPGAERIVGIPGYLPNMTDAARTAQTLKDTMMSQIAVQAINAMRAVSKTGGAIGNVTEAEWPRLEAQITALGKAQDYKSFRTQLDNLISYLQTTQDNIKGAYQGTYGSIDVPLPKYTPVGSGSGSNIDALLKKYGD